MFTQVRRFFILLSLTTLAQTVFAQNQTDVISPIYSPDSLPFTIDIQLADFEVPAGLQSYAYAIYDNKCLLITGKTDGLHGFNDDNDNFPPRQQNTSVYVVDLKTKKIYSKSLLDPSSGLSQEEIDSLSVSSVQFFQSNKKLYLVGGYGVITETGQFNTKSVLSSINVPGLMHWVQKPSPLESAKQHIRQVSHPVFQVTGGDLYQANPHAPFLLIFGQNFPGFYTDGSNGIYTQQVRTFNLIDDEKTLAVFAIDYKPQNANYRRRDINIVPIIQKQGKNYMGSFLALSGVFTLEGGAWTVPVSITELGDSFMPDPSKDSTLKQGMNNYNSAHFGFFSKKSTQMYTVICGGMSYEVYQDGTFVTDSELPFNNNVTAIAIDNKGTMTQHLLEAEYPVILSTVVNPDNPFLFGSGARFIPLNSLPIFPNGVFSLDSLNQRTLIGYIIGGIMSTLPNTNTQADSAASPYIFSVFATPR